MAAKKSDTVKVQLRVPTLGAGAGDTIEVERDQVEALVANGHIVPLDDKSPDSPQG